MRRPCKLNTVTTAWRPSTRAVRTTRVGMERISWNAILMAASLLGNLMLSESWPLRQVIPLALWLAAPFMVGAIYAYSDDPTP
jgi:drug/metabolite transporter (DMT)-like permease